MNDLFLMRKICPPSSHALQCPWACFCYREKGRICPAGKVNITRFHIDQNRLQIFPIDMVFFCSSLLPFFPFNTVFSFSFTLFSLSIYIFFFTQYPFQNIFFFFFFLLQYIFLSCITFRIVSGNVYQWQTIPDIHFRM